MNEISELRKTVRESSIRQALSAESAVLLDIRESAEVSLGMIPGALHLPLGELPFKINQIVPEKSTRIFAYCASGIRSLYAAKMLEELGYTDVYSVRGGYKEYISGCSIEDSRYARQIVIPEIGVQGQRRLSESSVLIVGAGGIGAPAALYLTAAGVGEIKIADGDSVQLSNLHRQILFRTADVGSSKVQAASSVLSALNPEVRILAVNERVNRQNISELLTGTDLVIDGSDNFATRYLMNDSCLILKKPLLYAAVHRFKVMLSLFGLSEGPCLRCLFPEEPPADLIPNCAEAGVIGTVPGMAGLMAANEALKFLVGIGANLSGRIVELDCLSLQIRETRLKKRKGCCG